MTAADPTPTPEQPACDICGGTDPPRNPYWRDNITKTCDPCEERLTTALQARVADGVTFHAPPGHEDIAEPLNRAMAQVRPEQDEAVRHPRTYSLVGTPHLFLVTDDESGINIGYANKIGGPLVAPALATPPPVPAAPGLDEEHESWLREFLWWNHGHRGAALYGDDGELQCKACGHWDYRRDPLSVLIEQAQGHAGIRDLQAASALLSPAQEEAPDG